MSETAGSCIFSVANFLGLSKLSSNGMFLHTKASSLPCEDSFKMDHQLAVSSLMSRHFPETGNFFTEKESERLLPWLTQPRGLSDTVPKIDSKLLVPTCIGGQRWAFTKSIVGILPFAKENPFPHTRTHISSCFSWWYMLSYVPYTLANPEQNEKETSLNTSLWLCLIADAISFTPHQIKISQLCCVRFS